MQIDHCLILAAGFGTRMGEIGRILPKPLWPIFELTLLELQVKYAMSLGINNIFINTHFQNKKIQKLVDANEINVKILYESDLLGSGGAIHNLANQKEIQYKGNVLLLNSDVFYFFDFNKVIADLEDRTHLFSLEVSKEEKYNEVKVTKDNCIFSIESPEGKTDYSTYSGVGIINLNHLKRVDGYSSFFESVCPYREEKVKFIKVNGEYWDFGTDKLYYKNLFKVLNKKDSLLYKFLIKNEAIDLKKMKEGYNSNSARVINLDQDYFSEQYQNKIILKSGQINSMDKEIVLGEVKNLLEP